MKIEMIGTVQQVFAHDDVRAARVAVNSDPNPNYPQQRVWVGVAGTDIELAFDPDHACRVALLIAEGARRVRVALGETTPDYTPVLFFDEDGCGPSTVGMKVTNLAGRQALSGVTEIPDSLGLRIGALAGEVVYKPILGGFMLHRVDAEVLYREIGAWLAAHPAE